MLGLRSLFRSYLYDIRQALPTRDSRRLMQYVGDAFEYDRLQLMVIMSRPFRYLYMVNPKVASTSVRNVLHRLNGFDELDDPRDVMGHERSGFLMPRDMSTAEFCDFIESPDIFRFSFVRNPFSRLVSGYVYFQDLLREKIARGKRPCPYRLTRRLDPRRDPVPRQLMTFDAFIRAVCLRRDIVPDLHFRLQSEVLLMDRMDYDFIGHMESFDADIRTVLQRLGAPEALLETSGRVTNASRQTKPVADWFTPELADLVRQRFARDFVQFGYSLDVADTAPAVPREVPARQHSAHESGHLKAIQIPR